MTISLGYQIPNFTYPGGAETLFDTVLAQAREAEANGFDTVLVMDHFYQLPGIGTPDQPMMEAYSTLAALAASTDSIQLSALVTGNTYRNPTLLAKTVTTLDVISHGRAILGIGAGWFELEHQQLGFDFDTFTERFEKLDAECRAQEQNNGRPTNPLPHEDPANTRQGKHDFSLMKVYREKMLHRLGEGPGLTGIELETHQELVKRRMAEPNAEAPKGVLIPWSLRVNTAASARFR